MNSKPEVSAKPTDAAPTSTCERAHALSPEIKKQAVFAALMMVGAIMQCGLLLGGLGDVVWLLGFVVMGAAYFGGVKASNDQRSPTRPDRGGEREGGDDVH